MFVIEDSIHCELHHRFDEWEDAVAELMRLSVIPWDEPPNRAPCTGWRRCSREWEVVEYDDSSTPWKRLWQEAFLRVGSRGTRWLRVPNPDSQY